MSSSVHVETNFGDKIKQLIRLKHIEIDQMWQAKFDKKVAEMTSEMELAVEITKSKKWCDICRKEIHDGIDPPACSLRCLRKIASKLM